MTTKLYSIVNGAKEIFREEGLLTLIKRTFSFLVYVIQSAISYENSVFYVYGRTLKVSDEANRMPRIQNFIHRMIETAEQLEEVRSEGFDLSLIDINQYRYRLAKGAVLSLIFVDHELACTSWSALTKEAKNTFNKYPYKVDFENGEVCGGATWTNPKYRRQGLNYYTQYKKEQYLISKGAVRNRTIVLSSNTASQRGTIKTGNELVAKARYIRIFGLQFWREQPVKSID